MTPPSGSRVSHENAIRASAMTHITSTHRILRLSKSWAYAQKHKTPPGMFCAGGANLSPDGVEPWPPMAPGSLSPPASHHLHDRDRPRRRLAGPHTRPPSPSPGRPCALLPYASGRVVLGWTSVTSRTQCTPHVRKSSSDEKQKEPRLGGRRGRALAHPPQPILLMPCGTALDRRPLGRDSRSSAHTVQMNRYSRKTPASIFLFLVPCSLSPP